MTKQKDINDTLLEDGIEAALKRFDNEVPGKEWLHQNGGAAPEENGNGAADTNGSVFQLKPKRVPQPSWRDNLLLTPTKTPRPLLANALTALRQAPEWQGVLAYDEFALVTMLMKPPPWRKPEDNSWTPIQWTDRDDVLTTDWLHHELISVSTKVAADVVEAAAKDNSFHPVRDYLNGLEWDGTKRIESFASCYLGAADTPYHRAVSRSMFIAAVARVMRPGCKVDCVPILEGPQGKGKSTAIQTLFEPWFTDDIAELGTKDAAMQVRSAWCIELGELSSMTRGDIEKVKAFITRKVDRFRPSYGRRVIEVPRQTILIGSTNLDTYLKDETGGRRYWPILCEGKLKLADIKRDKGQFWAEAVSEFKAGTPWWLSNDMASEAEEEQAKRYVGDAWHESISRFVRTEPNVSIGDVLMSLGIEKSRWTQADQNWVARCLKTLGWERYQGPRPHREWRYRPAGTTSDASGTGCEW
jgi:predicted P-loop ATPase